MNSSLAISSASRLALSKSVLQVMASWMVVLSLSCVAFGATTDDWPQWMGPNRDNVWQETGILKSFPEDGLKVAWRTPVAGGYAGPAVADGRVIVTDYQTSDNVKVANFQREKFTGIERVFCLDEQTGKPLWKFEYPVEYSISYPAGPRCTPIIHEGMVYTLGAEGHLYCFDFESGEVVWSHDLKSEYKTKAALWGYAAHPLIDGDKLITLAGGEGSLVVALNKNTGAELWRSLTSPEQGYSPPTIIEAANTRQLVLSRPNEIAAINPETGEKYWSVPYEATSGSIIMSPLKVNNYLYIAGYSKQNLLLELNQDQPTVTEVYRNKSRAAISPVNVQPIVDGDMIYGFDQDGRLYGIKAETGERVWSTTEPLGERPIGNGTAFIVRNGDRYFLFTENGDLILCEIDAEGYREIDRVFVLKPTNQAFNRDVLWCQPAFANRRMYVRNDEECICVELAE